MKLEISIYDYDSSENGEYFVIEADAHFDDGKLNHGWETIKEIIVPFDYITNEEALKVAVGMWKKEVEEKHKVEEIEKEKNLKEYKEYLRLKKKFTEDSSEMMWKLYLDNNEDKDNE